MSETPTMTALEFAAKWLGCERTERAASQEHFIDLCRLVGVSTPNEADPKGNWYAFEKGAEKVEGGDGFADVWKRNHFAWEYKGKRKNLADAYGQLLQYRESLENPPCLVVCDLDRFEIHTNFTGTRVVVHKFSLEDLQSDPSEPLRLLRGVMKDPESLRPQVTAKQITEAAASRFAEIAGELQDRGHEPRVVAHFLNKLLFCLFAEDAELLPRNLLTSLIKSTMDDPDRFCGALRELFSKMVKGGQFGTHRIEWFNGGLFDDDCVLPLKANDLKNLLEAALLDWSSVEPAILGTLFERGLDPSKRSQLGAHYTDKESILRVVEPVVIAPLRREFEAMKARVTKLLSQGMKSTRRSKPENNPTLVFQAFLDRLRTVTVLDPACGSGNFLYVTLQLLKDLEKEVIIWGAETLRTALEFPRIGPAVVHGIELNAYAAELARVTIWIGHIQWMIANGFSYRKDPILQPLKSVERRDAVVDLSDPTKPRRAEWPKAEFIVGNPPFLGGKRLREVLGDTYVNDLFAAWDGHVPREADLVTYWHEKAREQIQRERSSRAGLLATQGIRRGANQTVLKKIKETGDIFRAWSDEPWVVEGAAVRISIVCQDDGSEADKCLDGQPVDAIHPDLSGSAEGAAVLDLTGAMQLSENFGVAFMADTKGGKFDIPGDVARDLLKGGPNHHGKPNSDVVVPWMNSMDLTRRPRDMFIVDFGVSMTEHAAAEYEAPFEYLKKTVKKAREDSRSTRKEWWLHERPRPDMRNAIANLGRFIVTPTTAKHRVFAWARAPLLPDHQLIVIARDDDYALGVLHSSAHEAWSLRMIGRKGVGNDPVYAPTFAFETFPFPWSLATTRAELGKKERTIYDSIAEAARKLDEARSRWLNPPELVKEVPDVLPHLPPRRVPLNSDAEKQLKTRTLTNLYNARPTWLDNLHKELDRAVLAAYDVPPTVSKDALLAVLLELNHDRAGAGSPRRHDA